MVGTHLLPPNLLKLFAPRPPLPYLKPTGRDPDFPLKSRARKPPSLGVADTLALIRDEREANEAKAAEEGAEGEQEDGEEKKEDGEGMYTLCGEEAFKLRVEQRQKDHKERLEQGTKNYNPADDEEVMGDPYKTLFVGRLPYALDEHDLRREFEMYGPLDRIRLVRDKDGKSRGYAFLIYEREKDMKAAYKDAEGLKLMNRRLLIDVERGRTVKGWKPRRLGGGLGGRPKPIAQAPPDMGFGGGFGGRGGGRGGFVQRGGFGGRGGGPGGFGDRRGGFGGGDRMGGGGGFRGGFGGGDRGGFNQGGFNNRGGFNGPPRGGGIGYGGDRGFNGGPPPPGGGYNNGPPGGGNFNGPPGGGNFGGGPPGGGGGFGGPPGPGRGYGGPPGGGYQGQNGPDSGYGKRPNDFGGGGFEDAKRPRY